MRNAVHNKRWDLVKEEVNTADLYIAQLKKPEKRDFVGSMFRNQMIDVMNQTNQLLERDEAFNYDDPTPLISKKFLPPLPEQILSNTATEAPDVVLEEQKTDLDYNPKFSKVQNNAIRLQKAMAKAQQNEQDPNFQEEQKGWLKAAKMEKPFRSLSQAFSRPTPPQKINKPKTASQPKQWNWMAQPEDSLRKAREAASKSQETSNNKPQKPHKPPKTKLNEAKTSEHSTPQSEQINWLVQPPDSWREAREGREVAVNEQEFLPSETVPDWRPQQEYQHHPEYMTDHTGPTYEETWDEDPTTTSQ
jgi:hypothetical protein